MNQSEAQKLLAEINISANKITQIKGSFDKDVFLIDDRYILRPSLKKMDDQIERYNRISHLDNVPKIVRTGLFEGAGKYNYILLTQIVGVEYFTRIPQLNDQENSALGSSLAAFMEHLHRNAGSSYDIGHYIPIIKDYRGTWKDGHARYWEYLHGNIDKMQLSTKSVSVIDEAFSFLNERQDCLNYQTGPVLLHNDFHPKNIIVDKGTFSGVIDWECSQNGEADFDLCHLFHWCIFPSNTEYAFVPMLKSILDSSIKCTRAPKLWERQTIYQIEHEVIQLIWSNGSSEEERILRLRKWINNEIGKFLADFRLTTAST